MQSVPFLSCRGKLCSYHSALRASLAAGGPGGTKQSVPVLWWGVNHSGKLCLCGHPGHSRAGWALRSSRQRVRSSTPVFRVSVERVIYACRDMVEGTYSWFWAVTAHCSKESGEGELVTFSLILQHLPALRGKNRDKKRSNPFADFPCSSAESAAPAGRAAHQYLTQTSLFL